MTCTSADLTDFTVAVPQHDVEDLTTRLRNTRFPNVPHGVPQLGVPLSAVHSLVARWRDEFDWSAVESRINQFPQVVLQTAEGARLYAVRKQSSGEGVPIVLLHGWADTFYSQLAVAGRLVAAGHDVVVPSLPGFAFSDHAQGPATAQAAADAVHQLMGALGYERYAVHGGDWGGAVAHTLMTTHAESVAAAHLTDIPYYLHFFVDRDELEQNERDFLDDSEARQEEPQYYRLQAGRPLTLAYGMADSPVALLTWLMNLYTAWTDRESDQDSVLAQASLYWLTNTFHSSMRLYSEGTDAWDEPETGEDGTGTADATDTDGAAWGDETAADESEWGTEPVGVPTAFAIHPADIVVPTRAYAERFFPVERFTLMPAGGHFAAMDVPDALADDIVAFLADVG